MKNKPDFNTLLITIVLGLSAWTLQEVIEQGKVIVSLQTKVVWLEKMTSRGAN